VLTVAPEVARIDYVRPLKRSRGLPLPIQPALARLSWASLDADTKMDRISQDSILGLRKSKARWPLESLRRPATLRIMNAIDVPRQAA